MSYEEPSTVINNDNSSLQNVPNPLLGGKTPGVLFNIITSMCRELILSVVYQG